MILIPMPENLQEREGNFRLNLRSTIVLENAEGYFAAGLLQREIRESLGFEVALGVVGRPSGEGNICLRFCEDVEGEEAYTLAVDEKEIVISAGAAAGLLYGVQTLRQLLRVYGVVLPCMEISDAPAIGRRGLSYDVTRGRVPTLEELKRQADLCAFYKMNELQLYVEHSYLFRDFSEVWRGSDPLTAEDILELDEYCRKLHIDLVPSLASFGHLYEVLRTKTYGELCELEKYDAPFSLIDRMAHHTLDVSNEKSFELAAGRIREYAKLFTSKYFNICADETFDLCSEKSKALGEEKGTRRVYLEFLTRLCNVVKELGKVPMFWGDVLLEEPGLLKELPENSIILNWEYAPRVTEDKTRTLAQAGVEKMYLCPGVQSWNHLVNRHSDAYANISGMCRNAHTYKVAGVLNTEWGDLGHPAHPEFSTIGQIYGAAFSWSKEIVPEEEINAAISLIQYGDRSGRLVDLFRRLGDAECIKWWSLVYCKDHFESLAADEHLSWTYDGERYEECLRANDEAMEGLYKMLPLLPAGAKEDVCAYLLLGQGQKLFAEAVHFLHQYQNLSQMAESHVIMETKKLAEQLEWWFADYKKLWRSTAKESELFRLGEIVFWCADRLRECR